MKTMDYEKKYKDALSWIKDVYPTFEGAVKEDAEHFFPELKESNDKRIKEAIRYAIASSTHEDGTLINGVTESEAIAYLEKQGEQKSINDTDEEIVEAVKNTSVLDLVEQNPAWSEDDELYLKDAIHAAKELYDANCGGDELVDWLKSLKDRVQPQPQKEWSEEDERMRKASIRACQYMVENFENSTWDYEDAIDWLKSLKERLQHQWKPSDEQIAALKRLANSGKSDLYDYRHLKRLLEQLEKL